MNIEIDHSQTDKVQNTEAGKDTSFKLLDEASLSKLDSWLYYLGLRKQKFETPNLDEAKSRTEKVGHIQSIVSHHFDDIDQDKSSYLSRLELDIASKSIKFDVDSRKAFEVVRDSHKSLSFISDLSLPPAGIDEDTIENLDNYYSKKKAESLASRKAGLGAVMTGGGIAAMSLIGGFPAVALAAVPISYGAYRFERYIKLKRYDDARVELDGALDKLESREDKPRPESFAPDAVADIVAKNGNFGITLEREDIKTRLNELAGDSPEAIAIYIQNLNKALDRAGSKHMIDFRFWTEPKLFHKDVGGMFIVPPEKTVDVSMLELRLMSIDNNRTIDKLKGVHYKKPFGDKTVVPADLS